MRRLLIRPGAIGDCITCLPAMHWLKTDYLEIWAPSAVLPLIGFADRVCSLLDIGINSVGLVDDDMPVGLRQRLAEFDEVVSWFGANRPLFCDVMGQACRSVRLLPALPPVDTDYHAVDFFAGQVGAPLGLIPQIQPCLTAAPRRSLVIHPFSGSARKNWPLARFRELAAGLQTRVEWVAGPEDDLPGAHRFDNLGTLADWLSGAGAYLGNDSGISHLAAALGLPTVALFGPSRSQVWRPRGARVCVLEGGPEMSISVRELAAALNHQCEVD